MSKKDYIISLPLIKNLVKRESEFVDNIIRVHHVVEDQLATRVPVVYPNFTLHDIKHCERILENISRLIRDIDKLTDLEIALLVYASLLHDIGMAVSDEIIESIKANNYCLTDIRFEILLERYNKNETYALQEILRKIHADISAEFVHSYYHQYFNFVDIDTITFTEEVALLCRSHTKDFIWLNDNLKTENEKSHYNFNIRYLSVLLRIGDILDIDGRRTPQILYHLINPQGISDGEWQRHFIITNIDKIKEDEQTKQTKVVFYGECKDVSIHRKLLRYIEWIENELKYANDITSKMKEKYKIYIKERVENNIEPVGYTISNYKLNMDFLAITNLLMGEKIYGSKHLGLRELIQNSIDACLLRAEIENRKKLIGEDLYKPVIKIILDKNQRHIIIKDNGTGMTEEIIKKYFLNIGTSYYQSDDFLLKGYNYKPVGNFGIGFLACFMLSDYVRVITKYHSSNKKYIIEMERNNEYISFSSFDDSSFSGTEIYLNYHQFMEQFEREKISIETFIQLTFITDEVQIEIIDRDNGKTFVPQNSIKTEEKKSKNEFYIDISRFMKDAQGFILVGKKNIFIKELSDIISPHVLTYYFSEGKLLKTNSIDIVDIINEDQLKYMDLELYEDSRREEFERAMDLVDNIDDVIYKLKADHHLSIFFNNKSYESLPSEDFEENEIEDYDLGINKIISQYESFCPKVYMIKQPIIKDDHQKLFMKFALDRATWYGIYDIYLRNVRINSFHKTPCFFSDIIEIKKAKINLYSKNIIPIVSRNSLTDENTGKVSYLISKIAHQAALEQFDFFPEEKRLFQKFLNNYYKETTNWLKD